MHRHIIPAEFCCDAAKDAWHADKMAFADRAFKHVGAFGCRTYVPDRRKRGRSDHANLRTGLGLRKANDAGVVIQPFVLEAQYLETAKPREQRKPDCLKCNRVLDPFGSSKCFAECYDLF